jgi:hypothetical protein
VSANARLVASAIAFVACAGAAVVSVRRPALGVSPNVTAPFRSGKIDTLEVTARGQRTTIRRRADNEPGTLGGFPDPPAKDSARQASLRPREYWVTAPVSYVADPGAANAAFEAIEKLDPNAIVTTRGERYEELQVDPAQGIGVRALLGDRTKLDLVIGKKQDEGTLVRVRQPAGTADPVWYLTGDLRALFDKVTAEWRDRSVTTFTPADARELAVDTRDGEHLVVRGEDLPSPPAPHVPRKWTLVRSSRDIPALDELVPNELVKTMSDLKASDFGDGMTPAAAGLDPPALTVTVTLKSGEKDVLLIGNTAGADESYVKTTESPQIFRVKAFNIERLAQRPVQFRNKLLCPLSDADIDEIAIRNGPDSFAVARKPGTQSWRATAPRGLRVDPAKVAPLASAFRSWRAPRIAEDRRASEVAGPGAITISGAGAKGRCVVTVVTNPAAAGAGGDDAFLAVSPLSTDVFVLPKWMIDRVALKLPALQAQ